MLKFTKNLDEYQLLKRGNVFQHGFFLALGLIGLSGLLRSAGISISTVSYGESVLLLLIPVTVCNVELIYHNIYPLSTAQHTRLLYLLGFVGVVEFVVGIIELVVEKEALVSSAGMSQSALLMIIGILFLTIFAAHMIRTNCNRRLEAEE